MQKKISFLNSYKFYCSSIFFSLTDHNVLSQCSVYFFKHTVTRNSLKLITFFESLSLVFLIFTSSTYTHYFFFLSFFITWTCNQMPVSKSSFQQYDKLPSIVVHFINVYRFLFFVLLLLLFDNQQEKANYFFFSPPFLFQGTNFLTQGFFFSLPERVNIFFPYEEG